MPHRDSVEHRTVRDHFRAVWPVHVEGMMRLLTALRGHFGGDLDLMLVLGVIGGRTLPSSWVGKLETYGHLTRAGIDAQLPSAINLQSIADYTGIPRETVRRKLAILLERGWVTRNKDGYLAATRKAGEDLEVATGDSLEYLADLFAVFERIRARHDRPA